MSSAKNGMVRCDAEPCENCPLQWFIEKGIHTGGGYAFFFGIPGVCDGIAMGHKGMHYSLPTRELIADMVESVAEAHRLDGLVLHGGADVWPGSYGETVDCTRKS